MKYEISERGFVPDGWGRAEWQLVYKRLRRLTLPQLRALAEEVGIYFTTEVDRIDYLNVIDEANRDELLKALAKVEEASGNLTF